MMNISVLKDQQVAGSGCANRKTVKKSTCQKMSKDHFATVLGDADQMEWAHHKVRTINAHCH